MPIYHHPPNPFIGGRQPLEGRELAPADAAPPTNNPPFSHRGRLAAAALVVSLWQPQPSYAFVGGHQPHAPQLTSPGIPGRAIDAPPALGNSIIVLDLPSALDSPQQRRRLAVFPGAPPDTRVPFRRDLVSSTSWYVPPPLPTLKGPLSPAIPGQSIDAPPALGAALIFLDVPSAGDVPQQRRELRVLEAAAVEPRVPFRRDLAAFAWHVAPQQAPQTARQLSPGVPGQSVDLPLPRARALPAEPWQPQPPRPPQQRHERSPGIPGFSVDEPPRLRKQHPAAEPIADTAQQRRARVTEGTAPASPDNPPRWRAAFRAWEAEPPAQPRQRCLPAVLLHVEPTVQFVPYGRTPAAIYAAWLSGDFYSAQRRVLSPGIPGQSVDLPPPARAHEVPRPIEPTRVDQRRTMAAALLEPTVQFVPFGRVPGSIHAAWRAPEVAQQRRALIVPESVDEPPRLSHTLVFHLEDSWHYVAPQPRKLSAWQLHVPPPPPPDVLIDPRYLLSAKPLIRGVEPKFDRGIVTPIKDRDENG